jgi:hypothetical protein
MLREENQQDGIHVRKVTLQIMPPFQESFLGDPCL